jgi:fibronectin-binding autotransporter adhesin
MSQKDQLRPVSTRARSSRLWAGASYLALSVAALAPHAASAATFNASDEASLKTAIQNANASADASSTITLTGNITITDPATLPTATKQIVLETAGFTVSDVVLKSASQMTFQGGGELQLAGVSTVAGDLKQGPGTLRIDGGAELNSGGITRVDAGGTLIVDGVGSLVRTLTFLPASDAGTTTIRIQNGGVVQSTSTTSSLSWGNALGAVLDFTVTGAGSRFDSSHQVGVVAAAGGGGSILVSAGGVMTAPRINLGSPTQVQPTPPSLHVDGGGSSVAVSGIFALYKGNLEVTGGGAVTANSFQIGGAGGTGRLLVSGAGSSITSTGSMALTGLGANSNGIITLTDGGVLHAGSLTLGGSAATRVGVLNIGGAEAAPAAAAGLLDTPSVTFGVGGGRINFNHTDTNYTFATPITGGGLSSLRWVSGVTHLTGDSSGYTGSGLVSGGELHVDGILGGSTSQIGVNNGGVLGGSGTVGGDVFMIDGVLAPGNSPGTLTIGGDLGLDPSSLLDVEFGQSGVVGGPMNDLVQVGGDLTLDGTVDVTVTAGGVFDAGLYRVINYGGALTNNTLAVGVTPPGSTVSVQTAIAGQVNLVNTAGLPVNFWDGAGAGGDGAVAGGSGLWTSSSTNWTTQTGAVNTAYTPNSFLIFAAAPGAVTFDNIPMPVLVGGMQFAVDGYSLGGSPVTLTGASATIRVGDGTSDAAGFVTTIDSELHGVSELVKTDLGTLILTATNNYTGGTQVSAGKLLINGDHSALAAPNVVDTNGTLGGTGVLGGDLVVGGTLAPGGLTAAGTLTVNGDVSFAAVAKLNYRLGAAGVAGGALNDLLVVNGLLTLNGTLNVTESAGGTFGPGVYRLIDYTGLMVNNVLDVGTLPGGYTGTIQTSIAGQINLLAAGAPPGGGGGGGGGGDPPPPPPMFNFWDGAGGAGDGTVSGGDGTWRASPANWTTSTGAANAAFTGASFAIFAGAPGTVTVDGSEGPIGVSGMQFASDGYRLTGDAVTLQAGENIVRVGDGTGAGEAFTATVGAELTGAGRLDKADAGTLVLTGANTYSGGTAISGGTLQLGDGGASGSVAGDVANDGVLRFNRSGEFAFGGTISGGGTIVQAGPGATILSADSSAFAGRTQVRSGTLAVDGALGGQVEVLAGGRLTGIGQVGALTNGGVVAPGHSVGVLTVTGDYAGAGGVLEMEAELGGDASQADRLVVRGATSGSTLIEVKRLGGTGAATSSGILLVQVDGASDGIFALTKGDYRLGGEEALVAGAYAYVLRKDDGDWRLRSQVDAVAGPLDQPPPPSGELVTLYQPAAPIYEAYPQALAALNNMGTLRQRTGARQWSGEAGASVWGRLEGGHAHLEPKLTTTAADLKIDRWKLQFGVDRSLDDDLAGGQLAGGLTAHYGEASTEVASLFGRGDIETKGYGFGANLTWTTTGGAYLDAQAQASWFDSDLASQSLGERARESDGQGYAVSIEAGKAMAAGGSFSFTPQAQLTYSEVDFDSFTDSFGAQVSADQGESLIARLGLALDHEWAPASADGKGRVYGLVNLSHEFLDGSRVDVSGARLASRAERTWGGLAAGVSYGWGAGRFLVYGEANADTSLSGFGDSYAAGGSAGFRMRF